MQRRRATGWNTDLPQDAPPPAPVQRWQQVVHEPGVYDLEVDTSLLTAQECAALIRQRLDSAAPATAFARLAAGQF
jgi:chloramphenicol 3-O phosphotransferase